MGPHEGDRPVVDRWDGGLTWIAHPDETMQRASHAVLGERGIWLIDPMDVESLDEMLAELGEVLGVVVLLDRHLRDVETLAARYDVPVGIPPGLSGLADAVDVSTNALAPLTADTGFEPIRIVDLPGWREYALYNESDGTVVFADALGTAAYFRAPGERLAVHPFLRLAPPRAPLEGVTVDRVLVGHGHPLLTDGTPALHDALRGARRRAPRVYAGLLRELPSVIAGEVRK